MKQYRKLIPLAIYPYVFLPWVALFLLTPFHFGKAQGGAGTFQIVVGILFVLFQILTLGCVIWHSACVARGVLASGQASKANLMVKCCHIPLIALHILVGIFWPLFSVWGIGFLVVSLVVGAMTLVMSGLAAVGCAVRLKRDGVLSGRRAVLTAIGAFVPVFDWIVAGIYRKRSLGQNGGFR